jgi:hypothetical protein
MSRFDRSLSADVTATLSALADAENRTLADDQGVPLHLRWERTADTEAMLARLGAHGFRAAGEDTLVRIVSHLIFEALGGRRRVHYSRNRSAPDYMLGSEGLTYRRVVAAVDWLAERGLIEHRRMVPGSANGQRSDMRATPLLLAVWFAARPMMLPPDVPLVIRSRNGTERAAPVNNETRKMARLIDRLNRAILGADFTSRSDLQAAIRRLFRDDLDHLGRFHTLGPSWQSFGGAHRRDIRIGGEALALLDYTAMIPTLAYLEIGEAPPPDLYALPGLDRKTAKLAMLIALNAQNARIAAAALHHHSGLPLEHARGAIAGIVDLHSALDANGLLFGSGLWLFRRESDIAAEVIRHVLDAGTVVLPIHDGFMVPESKVEILKAAMIEAGGRRLSLKREF